MTQIDPTTVEHIPFPSCGCVIRWDGPKRDGNLWIHFCSLHYAAADMLEALQMIRKDGVGLAGLAIDAAIAKATNNDQNHP